MSQPSDTVEINYDKDGNEKSVVISYEFYREMVSAASKYDDLKNKLHQLYFILADVLAQPATPVEMRELDAGDEADILVESMPEETETAVPAQRRDIRYYQRASGFYVDSKRFCVLAGSKVRGSVSAAFESIQSVSRLRDRLISDRILVRENG